jgi:hypothetical protein
MLHHQWQAMLLVLVLVAGGKAMGYQAALQPPWHH